jgi:hypothetical protein
VVAHFERFDFLGNPHAGSHKASPGSVAAALPHVHGGRLALQHPIHGAAAWRSILDPSLAVRGQAFLLQ